MRLLTAGAIVAATGVVVAAPDVAEAAPAPLTPRFSATLNGDVQMTGNAILTCPATDAVCQQVLIDGSASGNGRNMQYIDVDGGGASPTFNSSSAGVTLAAGATVAYAGLYWAGTVQGGPHPRFLGPAPRCCSTRRQRRATRRCRASSSARRP